MKFHSEYIMKFHVVTLSLTLSLGNHKKVLFKKPSYDNAVAKAN